MTSDLGRVPVVSNHLSAVLAGLVPAIHIFSLKGRRKDVDALATSAGMTVRR
jgi:hypothetical protein